MKNRTRKLITLAMLTAIAYLLVFFVRIPLVMFLSYEPKDVIIALAGFMYGPLEAFIIALLCSVLEMITISTTGWIGAVMNLISSCAFACTAAAVYRKDHTLRGALIGLLAGVASMCVVMLLWNWLLTPLYMGYPRADVAAMLVPVFLPFNLLKGGLNAAITLLIYHPVVKGLRKAKLLPPSSSSVQNARKATLGVLIAGLVLLASLILLTLIFTGVL